MDTVNDDLAATLVRRTGGRFPAEAIARLVDLDKKLRSVFGADAIVTDTLEEGDGIYEVPVAELADTLAETIDSVADYPDRRDVWIGEPGHRPARGYDNESVDIYVQFGEMDGEDEGPAVPLTQTFQFEVIEPLEN